MSKFRRKADIVDAIQVTADNLEEVKAFLGAAFTGTWDWWPGRVGFIQEADDRARSSHCDPGDWIVKDPYSRFVAVDDRKFKQYFEEVK